MDKHKLDYRRSTRAILIDKNNEVLLIQKHSSKNNEWSFPGGGIEEGETEEEAMLRELREETGFKTDKAEMIDGQYQYEWPDEVILKQIEKGDPYRGQKLTLFLVRFDGNRNDLIFQEDEIKISRWVPLDEALSILVFPELIEGFNRAVKMYSLKQ